MNSLSWWAVILSFAGISSDILPRRQYPLMWDTPFCWLPATVEYSIALLWGQDNVKRLKIVHVQFLNCVIYRVVHAILGNRDTHPLSSLLEQKLAPPLSPSLLPEWLVPFPPLTLALPRVGLSCSPLSVAPTVFTHNPNRRHATTCKVSTTTCKPELF